MFTQQEQPFILADDSDNNNRKPNCLLSHKQSLAPLKAFFTFRPFITVSYRQVNISKWSEVRKKFGPFFKVSSP